MFRNIFFTIVFISNSVFAFSPAVLMEVEVQNKNQTSYVGLGYKAVDSFKNLYNIDVPIYSSHGSKYKKEELLRKIVKKGHNPIITLGFLYSKSLKKVANEFPNKTFVIIDGYAGAGKNILNITFKEEEGSFLVGAIAAMKSKSNKIGFIGGMDIPVIRRFACGFIQGVKYVSPNTKVQVEMTGNTYLAFNNPLKGKKIAKEMIKKGIDVIFHASDRTGKGVIQAAKENGIYAIGVDANQNHEAPGTVLTSMVKRIDIAIYKVLIDFLNKQKSTEDVRLGLKEEGISWSLDKYNINLIDSKTQKLIDDIEFNIVEEIIEVEDYTTNSKCKNYNFEN